MMRYFLGTNGRTNERTNKAILGVGFQISHLGQPEFPIYENVYLARQAPIWPEGGYWPKCIGLTEVANVTTS